MSRTTGLLHHVEIWVPDIVRTRVTWGWLLTRLGYVEFQDWPGGTSWKLGDTYLVFEQSEALADTQHDRLRPGLNHLAFHAGSREELDQTYRAAIDEGWIPLFADRYPYAGGVPTGVEAGHYAGYLTDPDGFEIELVATAD